MARNDALLKLNQRLKSRRQELRLSIAEGIGDLRRERAGQPGGDEADAATETMNSEMISQLAQIESKELKMIERAMARLHDGTYGSCEICNRKIPVARLNALPYTTLCILCQREREANPELGEDLEDSWQKVFDSESSSGDISVKLSDLEYNLG